MKKPYVSRLVRSLVLAGLAWLTALSASAQAVAASAAPAAPTNEERIAALEAYVTNSDPGKALTGVPGPGHNGWMMTSSALVLFMTLPGLALFYGGLVRRKNVLSVLAQCLGITGLVALLWWAFGYSFVFGKSAGSSVFGGWEFAFLRGVGAAPNTDYAFWVSHSVFAMYQMMFAIITPVLIIGAIAERMKYSAILLFVAIWMVVVYFPLAHMVWGATGLMNGVWNGNATIKAIDFAGGTVVHMSSGWSALVLCLILGPRLGFGKDKMAPHSMVLCMVGTGMLWVGWYGFNAGSALSADGIAANAFMTTTLAAAIAGFTWGMIELVYRGHASILGFCSGIVAGLVVITPATAPEQKPRILGLPRKTYSAMAQVKEDTAVAMVVVVNALAAMPSAATALPALKPYQPTHSMPVPTMQRTMLCGGIGSLPNPSRLPRIRQRISADHPDDMCTTVPPAKSMARIFAAGFHTPFIKPSTPQTMCASGK